MSISSEERICTVHSPLEADKLILRDLDARESVSGLYVYEARLTSEDVEIDFTQLLGQHASFELRMDEKSDPRFFSGIISRFSQQEDEDSNNVYFAQLVPWFWLTTESRNCRIFHDKTVIEIVDEVLRELSLPDFEFKTHASYDPIPYCVQYQESDFNFISRLLERAGISYSFKHEQDRHIMILTDSPSGIEACPGQESATYVTAEGDEETPGRVLAWHAEQVLRPGVFSQTDYNMETPSFDLQTSDTTSNSMGAAQSVEVYEYPGGYGVIADGESLARLQIEREEVAAHSIRGRSTCPHFCPGYKFDLEGHYRASYDSTYLLTEVQHYIHQSLGSGNDVPSSYENSFVCVPHSMPYRPPLRTEKPFIRGLQPATVVAEGGGGGEIDVDDYGRVLVHFPWDRKSDGCSCRVRVSQNWAGAKWGGTFFPHVGQEVLVGFLEGDPDRPIVAGRVYNGENMPPLEPATATQSIIRDHGGNQIVMEGADGSQRISMYSPHGETKFNMGAPNSPDEGFWLETALDQGVKIGGNVKEWFGGNEERTVDGNATQTVQGNQQSTTVGTKKQEVKGQVIYMNADIKSTNTIGATHDTFVGGKLSTFHGYAHSINRGWKRTIDSASVVKEAADKEMKVKNDYEMDIGSKFFVEAGTSIEFKVGGSTLELTPDGISLIGKAIEVHSTSGKVLVTSKAAIDLKPKSKVNIPKGKLNDKHVTTG